MRCSSGSVGICGEINEMQAVLVYVRGRQC